MKNLKLIKLKKASLKDIFNNLQNEINKKITKKEFLEKLKTIEFQLRYTYQSDFTLKIRQKKGSIDCAIFLNKIFLINLSIINYDF